MSNKNIVKEKRAVSIGNVIFSALLFLLFGIKLYLLYAHLHLAGYELCFTLLSDAMFLLAYAIIHTFSPKGARCFAVAIYFFFSVVLATDGVFYLYVSKLPSAAQLAMVGKLADVSTSIADLIKFWNIVCILDLPLWVLWAIDGRDVAAQFPRLNDVLSAKRLNRFLVSGAAALLAILSAAGVFLFTDFLPEYIENEIFTYHFTDIVNCLSKPKKREVDESLYTFAPVDDEEIINQDPLYGVAKDRNLIIIQVEALQNFVLGATYEGQELTPTLNALLQNDTLYFENYYYQIGGGNTADAEFAVNNSLFAPENEAAYMKYPNNDYFGLPKLVKENGYSGAYAFHGYNADFWNRENAYVSQGFDDFTSLEDFEHTEMFPMGLSDMEFFRQSVDRMKTYEEPFYSFLITVSSHYPFALPLEARDITLKESDVAKLFGLYIQSMNYVDRAIGQFIEYLKDAGLYDNSMIVIYGDHYALTNTDAENAERVKALLGRSYTLYDVFNVPCLIHIPGLGENKTYSVAGGHMDLLPTMLYLLGIQNDKSVMFGQNLLTAEHGFVCEQAHMSVGSFISDEVLFKKPHNNIKSNYDAYEFGTMNRLNPDDFEEESNLAAARIADCAALLAENRVLLTPKIEQEPESEVP